MTKIKEGYFEPVKGFTKGYAIVKGDIPSKYQQLYWQAITSAKKGNEILINDREGMMDDFRVTLSRLEKYGLIDETGEIILDLIYDYLAIFDEEKNRYVYTVINNKWSIYDLKENKWVYENEFDSVSVLFFAGNDEVPVSDLKYIGVCKNDKWGYLDSDCKLIIPYIYEYAFSSSENCLIVKENYTYSIISPNNTYFSKNLKYLDLMYAGADCFVVFNNNCDRGLIDKYNNVIIPINKDNKRVAVTILDDIVLCRKYSEKQEYFKKNGEHFIPGTYDEGIILDEKTMYFRKDDKLYDLNSKIVLENVENLLEFPENYNYFGVVDKQGKRTIYDKNLKEMFSGYYDYTAFTSSGYIIAIPKGNYIIKELDYYGNIIRTYPKEIDGIKVGDKNKFFALIKEDWVILDRNDYN